MDLLISIVIAVIFGYKRLKLSGEASAAAPVIDEAGVVQVSESNRQVGHNLMLQKEPNAFMMIVNQFNLLQGGR